MCLAKAFSPKMNTAVASAPAPAQVAAYDNQEATQQADIEARLRRRRAGAAADVLTGARGLPATPTLGGVAT